MAMVFLIFILITILIICFFQIFTKRERLNEISDLDYHGYSVKHDIISESDIGLIREYWDKSEFKKIDDIIKNNKGIKEFIDSNIKLQGYRFMDYIMFLEKSVLHTCHRDNNSSRFNNTKPSYTMILYIDDMEHCLDVIPKSHKDSSGIYLYDKTKTFMCKSGSIILFDASLVHCGSIDSNNNNRRIQLKVSHEKDLDNLSFYQNYHKIINKPNNNSDISKRIQKHFSCSFPVISDITQGMDKNYIKGEISPIVKIFSKLFYSDKDYYKLQDVF